MMSQTSKNIFKVNMPKKNIFQPSLKSTLASFRTAGGPKSYFMWLYTVTHLTNLTE